MNAQWKPLFVKILVWLVAEVLLNVLGLDTLADYGEFRLGMVSSGAFQGMDSAISLVWEK